MDDLESKIIEVLQRGTPLRAIDIAKMLGVERREINHYLYSSLKYRVVQDNDYKWSLKVSNKSNTENSSNQSPTSQAKTSHTTKQESIYRYTKKDISRNEQIKPSIPHSQSSQPLRQTNPYEIIKRELAQASPEEKVKILENAFRQELFNKLEDIEINALQSILEQSKREISITNTAYQQGKLSVRKINIIAIASVCVALTLGILFAISQFTSKPIYQPSPTTPENR